MHEQTLIYFSWPLIIQRQKIIKDLRLRILNEDKSMHQTNEIWLKMEMWFKWEKYGYRPCTQRKRLKKYCE